MDNKQAIEQLKSSKDFQTKCVEVLDIAIKALERTALEVPVQEQWLGKCQYCGKENEIDLPINKGLVPKFCSNCGEEITYVKKER